MSSHVSPREHEQLAERLEARRRELLAVSFTYPPSALPRAVQVTRLLKHLRASTTLVCADHDEKEARQDPALVAAAEEFLERIVRVSFSSPAWRKRAGGIAYRLNLPIWNRTPDSYRTWKRPVLKAIEMLTGPQQKIYHPDILVTFGAPMSDHLIGLELKRRYRWPWVAHFSDPWADNPFNRHDPLTGALNVSLERKVAKAADRLVFTSQETLDLVMSKYATELRRKARVLPHAFEPELYEASRQNDDAQHVTIRYLGDLYGGRTPGPLFNALARLMASEPELLSDVSFELIGPTYDLPLEKLGLRSLPEGLVSVKPPVSYHASLSLMSTADGLLVIDAPAEKSVFLPSKLIDYIGAGRPILGLTPPGTSARLINQLGGWCADPSDVNAMTGALRSFIRFLRDHRESGQNASWGSPDVRTRYESSIVAKAFEKILDETLQSAR